MNDSMNLREALDIDFSVYSYEQLTSYLTSIKDVITRLPLIDDCSGIAVFEAFTTAIGLPVAYQYGLTDRGYYKRKFCGCCAADLRHTEVVGMTDSCDHCVAWLIAADKETRDTLFSKQSQFRRFLMGRQHVTHSLNPDD
jgi:hypothetical protein